MTKEPCSCLGKSIVGCGDSSKSRILEKGTCLDLALDVAFISVLGLLMVGIRVSCFCPLDPVCELVSTTLRFYTRERP